VEHRSNAIILKVTDYGEADRLVTFFTDSHGKLKGVAKNAKRSVKRFGGGLEIGTIGRVRFAEKAHVELVRLEDIAVETPAWKVASSLEKIIHLHAALELADRMLPSSHPAASRFALLSKWIGFLAASEPLASHWHAFVYKWLLLSGVEPVFDRCVVCGRDGEEDYAGGWSFEERHGGLVCPRCHKGGGLNITVAPVLMKYLEGLRGNRILGGPGVQDGADTVFECLVIHAIGRPLRSLGVADKIWSSTL
jgi:DNA repair protein RecO (recombination protein O)